MGSNFTFIRDCLLRVARDFTICLKYVAKFVTQYRRLLSDPKSLEVLRKWCKQIFSAHTTRGHDLEIAWTLAICGVLGLAVDQTYIGAKQRVVSPVVLAILGFLSADGLLKEPWDQWKTPAPGRIRVDYRWPILAVKLRGRPARLDPGCGTHNRDSKRQAVRKAAHGEGDVPR